MKTIIISGSSRNDGETKNLTDKIIALTSFDIIDLNDYNISYYDYKHENRNDDFIPLMEKIIKEYEFILFVTPVYWYAMSGIMKVFFDRLTDVITIEKELGRQLRGKEMSVITTSYGNHLGEHFWHPFRETANYLGIRYKEGLHTISRENFDEELQLHLVQL